jgi:hypothetical protein
LAESLVLLPLLFAAYPDLMKKQKPATEAEKETLMENANFVESTNNLDEWLYWIGGIVALSILILILVRFIFYLDNFSHQLKYLNVEIKRTHGSERMHYIRRRRRLWLSLIPFVKRR